MEGGTVDVQSMIDRADDLGALLEALPRRSSGASRICPRSAI
jgi:hypothetical protein